MESSGLFTPTNSPAQTWGLRFHSELTNGHASGFGSNPSPDGIRRFALGSSLQRAQGNSSDLKPRSILLVEDNQADAALVRESLQEHGVLGELIVIDEGDRAIRFIEALDTEPARCPDLFIIDLNLPKVPGLELVRMLRLNPRYKDVPVAVLSSSDIQKDKNEAMRLGASHYICKPLRLKDFLSLGAIFRTLLENQS